RRTIVTGRAVAVDRAVAVGAREPVVRATRALAGVADRTRLDQRPAGAARAIRVHDATVIGIRAGHAVAGLARARCAIRVRATDRVGGVRGRAPAGVVGTGAAARAGRRVAAEAAGPTRGAVPAGVGSTDTPIGHGVPGQEELGGERQIEGARGTGAAVAPP